jgi:uncharacterized membrane protein
MRKDEFIANLKVELNVLPKQELDERLNFYNEIIDDKIENGTLEEDAVKEIGPIKIIASQILADYESTNLEEKSLTPKRKLKAWEIVLLAVGSPIWFSILVAVVSVVFSLFVSTVAVVFSLFIIIMAVAVVVTWACFGIFSACSVSGILVGIVFALTGNLPTGLAFIGSGVFLFGLAIPTYFLSKITTKFAIGKLPNLLWKLISTLFSAVKRIFVKKEKVQ